MLLDVEVKLYYQQLQLVVYQHGETTLQAAMTSEDVLQAIETQWHEVLKGHTLMTRHGYVNLGRKCSIQDIARSFDPLYAAISHIHCTHLFTGFAWICQEHSASCHFSACLIPTATQ